MSSIATKKVFRSILPISHPSLKCRPPECHLLALVAVFAAPLTSRCWLRRGAAGSQGRRSRGASASAERGPCRPVPEADVRRQTSDGTLLLRVCRHARSGDIRRRELAALCLWSLQTHPQGTFSVRIPMFGVPVLKSFHSHHKSYTKRLEK